MRHELGMIASSGVNPFQARLMPGERILWHGRPQRGLYLRGIDYFQIVYGSIFAFVGMKVVANWQHNPQITPFAVVFGVFFVVAGLFPVLGRIFVDSWLRRRLAYAVTDKRILIERAGPFGRFASLSLNAMPNIHLIGSAAVGSLRFGEPARFSSRRFMYLSNAMPTLDPVPQFLNIAEPDKVLALITRTAEAGLRKN